MRSGPCSRRRRPTTDRESRACVPPRSAVCVGGSRKSAAPRSCIMYCEAITEFGKPLQRIEGPTPTPTGTEVLVRVEHCGVCHSDVHIHEGFIGMGGGAKLPLGLPLPHTLGHEVAGEVIAVGPDADPALIGQHFALYSWIGCGKCAA